MRYLYTLCFYIALPFVFLRLLWRSRNNPAYRKRWNERLGFCPFILPESIWVHAVSVGETIAAIPLIKALKARYPETPLLVTNMTITGALRVKAAFGDAVLQAYVPYDLPDATARFLKRIQPKVIVIMETELWPNLFFKAKQKNIPIVLANARLSEKSANGYQRIATITREMLSAIQYLASQGHADADRFIALGMPKDRITVTGNIKFDLEIPANLAAKSKTLRAELGETRPIWVAASTHPGEEENILEAHRLIREKIKDALLILVPRHPERFDSVATLSEQKGFITKRRSRQESCSADTAVYLGDTMGEMLLMYSVADAAFIGGSFVPVGGHNMLEAAVLQKPVLTGPYLFNFAEISQMLLSAKGMGVVENQAALVEQMMRLLMDVSYRNEMGNHAKEVVLQNRGALQKQVDGIARVMR